MLYKNRYSLPELNAVIDTKRERLMDIEKESELLRKELILLTEELMSRSVETVMHTSK